jgi:hypothetical protein
VRRLTRRGLLGATAVAALARPSSVLAAPSEPTAIRALLAREDAAAAAYALAAERTGHATLQRIGAIDERHAHVLRVGLEALTIAPTHRPAHAERNDPAAARLARAASVRAALAEAVTLEQELLASYVDATRSLVDAGLLETVATIAASHAQQLAVLRDAAGRAPLDEPTVNLS